jgi:hypothetical protein
MALIAEGSFWVWLVLTVILGGSAAFLAGRAIARGWKPLSHAIVAMVPMAVAVRFLHFALFDGQLTSIHYFVVDFVVMIIATYLGHQTTKITKMVSQYPWLYEKTGPFGLKPKR